MKRIKSNQYLVNSPFHIIFNKKGSKWAINLNTYRNTNYFLLNKVKKLYLTNVKGQILLLPEFERISLTITIFPRTLRLFDLGNIGSITEKFFLDALVNLGKLPDDNYKYVPEVLTKFGSVDRENPRIEITIKEL